MIQETVTLTRPSSDIPWHWFVVNRSNFAVHVEQNYILTEKMLTQYEENPDELTSIWIKFWDSEASIKEFHADPEVQIYRKACNDYNKFVGITMSDSVLTEAE